MTNYSILLIVTFRIAFFFSEYVFWDYIFYKLKPIDLFNKILSLLMFFNAFYVE
jgi:hypothetical protein